MEKVKEEEEEKAVLKEEETVMVMISHLPKTRVFASRRCLKAALQRVSRQRHYPIEYACAAREQHDCDHVIHARLQFRQRVTAGRGRDQRPCRRQGSSCAWQIRSRRNTRRFRAPDGYFLGKSGCKSGVKSYVSQDGGEGAFVPEAAACSGKNKKFTRGGVRTARGCRSRERFA